MTDPHPTLVEFLRARLDEDEAAALHAKEELAWHAEAFHDPEDPWDYARSWRGFGRSAWTEREGVPISSHIARHDPARVLAEVEAKRRIVDHEAERMHSDWRARVDEHHLPFDEWRPTAVLRLLALPYADHPDYDPSWRSA